MILQRYTFGSKSQRTGIVAKMFISCLWYCKDIHLEANHNFRMLDLLGYGLLMILQRYTFGSKSQLLRRNSIEIRGCLWYCKDIHLEANHNGKSALIEAIAVAYDIAKIYIWKQITTLILYGAKINKLFMILQR